MFSRKVSLNSFPPILRDPLCDLHLWCNDWRKTFRKTKLDLSLGKYLEISSQSSRKNPPSHVDSTGFFWYKERSLACGMLYSTLNFFLKKSLTFILESKSRHETLNKLGERFIFWARSQIFLRKRRRRKMFKHNREFKWGFDGLKSWKVST